MFSSVVGIDLFQRGGKDMAVTIHDLEEYVKVAFSCLIDGLLLFDTPVKVFKTQTVFCFHKNVLILILDSELGPVHTSDIAT